MRRILIAVSMLWTVFLSTSLPAADVQEGRKAFIQKLIDRGVFQKVEVPGNLPHLWVRPAFYSLDFDTKSQFVNVVYAYHVTQNSTRNIVVLYDSRTGKSIGKYVPDLGGLKLD